MLGKNERRIRHIGTQIMQFKSFINSCVQYNYMYKNILLPLRPCSACMWCVELYLHTLYVLAFVCPGSDGSSRWFLRHLVR